MTPVKPLAEETDTGGPWRQVEPVFWGLVLVGVLFTVSLHNDKLFHALVEFVSVAVAWTIFMVMWNSRRFFNSAAFQVLAVGLLFAGIIDVLHTLAYKGIDVFDTDSANLPTQLWIFARYLQAVSVLVASLLVTRKIGNGELLGVLLVSAVVSVVGVLTIFFSGTFPDCYVEPAGLTGFKIASEYIISAMLLAGGVVFFIQRAALDRSILVLLLVSIAVAVVGEMAFTLYHDVYGIFNQVGHYCKLISFFLVYVAFVRVGLREPYRLLFRDLHNRQEALRANEQKYRGLIGNLRLHFVYVHGVDGVFTFISPSVEDILGWTPDQFQKHYTTYLTDNPINDLCVEYTAKSIEGIPQRPYEVEVVDKDGRAHLLEVTETPVRDESGTVVAVEGIAQDITERRRADDQRRELEAGMLRRQKLESLGILAGGVAHDFNNLLTVILGNTEMALTDVTSDSPVAKSLQETKKASVRAAKLTDQMLAYAGKARPVVRPVDVNGLVSEMTDLLRTAISPKVTLVYEFTDAEAFVRADVGQLQQVVMNLITNAADAMGENGGTVVIRTHMTEADAERLANPYLQDSAEPGTYLCLEVIDSGCGMDEDAKTRLFDPFYTTKFTGRGLGLAAVLGIIRTHGGAIQVDSVLGRGSVFRVFLPASEESEVSPQDSANVDGVGGTVLFADDDRAVRQAIRQMLESIGLVVLTATNGQHAVAMFAHHRDEIDAVLLDVAMPEMDGREALTRIHEMSPNVPIFLCSGYAKEDVADQPAREGLAGFIHKPFDLEALKLTLRSALNGK